MKRIHRVLVSGEKRHTHSKLYVQYLLPYLVVLLLCAMMSAVLYRTSLGALTHERIQRNQELLQEGIKRINAVCNEFDDITVELSQYAVYALNQERRPIYGNGVIKLHNVQKLLKRFSALPDAVWRSYLIYQSNSLVMDADNIYLLDDHYRDFLRPEGIDLAAWKNMLFSDHSGKNSCLPVRSIKYSASPNGVFTELSERKQVVCVTRSVLTRMQSDIILLFIMDLGELLDLFHPLSLSAGTLMIEDASGQVIAQWGEALEPETVMDLLNDKQYIGTQTVSTFNGWKYTLLQPISLVTDSLATYRRLVELILWVGLLGGFLLTLALSYRSSRPIATLAARLRAGQTMSQSGAGNGLQEIIEAVDNIMDKDEAISRRMQLLRPQFEQMFVLSLVHGEHPSVHELEMLAHQIDLALDNLSFGITVHMTSDYKATVHQAASIFAALPIDDLIGRVMLATHQNGYLIVLHLYSSEKSAEFSYQEDIAMMSNHSASPCAIGVGVLAAGIEQIPSSYEHAVSAMYRLLWQRGTGISEAHSRGDETRMSENSMARRTQRAILSGNYDTARECLQMWSTHFYSETPCDRNAMLYELCNAWIAYENCASMLQCDSNATPLDGLVQLSIAPADILAAWDDLIDKWMELCLAGHARRLKDERRQLRDMMDYVDKRYCDPAFCLNELADRMHMSVPVCSQQFKQADPRGFFVYLEEKRIHAAQQQLMDSNKSIENIALGVGYSSLSSFSRAFRRVCGVSATQYRKQRSIYIE